MSKALIVYFNYKEGSFNGMPMYAMPLYEVKYHGEEEWQEISDLELMNELYKVYNKVTPIIKEMIHGEEVETLHGIFRLKLKGGDQGGMQS